MLIGTYINAGKTNIGKSTFFCIDIHFHLQNFYCTNIKEEDKPKGGIEDTWEGQKENYVISVVYRFVKVLFEIL